MNNYKAVNTKQKPLEMEFDSSKFDLLKIVTTVSILSVGAYFILRDSDAQA